MFVEIIDEINQYRTSIPGMFEKKRNTLVTSRAGLTNIVCAREDLKNLTSEEIFLKLKKLENPYCCETEGCCATALFKSMFKGYLPYCHEHRPRSGHALISRKRKIMPNDIFVELFKHFDFYKKNLHNINVMDPCTGMNTKKRSLNGFLNVYFEKIIPKNVEISCIYCRQTRKYKFLETFFYPDDWECSSKTCSSRRAIIKRGLMPRNYDEVRDRLVKRFERTQKRQSKVLKHRDTETEKFAKNWKRIFICPITDITFYLDPNDNNKFSKHLKNINLTMDEYVEKCFPEEYNSSQNRCMQCNKKLKYNNNPFTIFSNNTPAEKTIFCNINCYHAHVKIHGFNISPEQKLVSNAALSQTMKDNIASGKFVPKTTNRRTHNKIFELTGKRYRSSWEFIVHMANPTWEYETVRVPYVDVNGILRTYIVDFKDNATQRLIEIKPKSMITDANTILKTAAAHDYARHNGMIYVILSEKEVFAAGMSIVSNPANADDQIVKYAQDWVEKRKYYGV